MLRPRTHARDRGLDQTPQSHFTEGRFGRLFRHLDAAEFADRKSTPQETLGALAAKMVSESRPKEGPIPAGYTYLGQFIDHDLTFDPVSSLQRDIDPASIVDYRTPRFDLDCIYGRGPADNPYLYREDGVRMRLGRQLTNRKQPLGYDVPRPEEPDPRSPSADDSEKALIGDPRNDENVIIAQLHALFLQFHNAITDKLLNISRRVTFKEVQQQVRWHYQWLVLYDFLPRIIHPDIYQQVLPHATNGKQQALEPPLGPKSNVVDNEPVLQFYKPEQEAYIPVEFSGAAYRFGHSMVRDKYRLNTNEDPGIGGPLVILSDDPKMNLGGFRSFRDDWGIEWGLFFEGLDKLKPQRASAIDTSLAAPLGNLPFPFATDMPSLAERNLVRGWRLGLPTGQVLAGRLGEKPLTEDELRVAGKVNLSDISGAFRNNAPLWYYILAEAASRGKGGTLGPVGSRIVMETFVGLMWEDGHSFLRQSPKWTPLGERFGLPVPERFGMTEFIEFAQGEQNRIKIRSMASRF
jgi:Animal haem peroxidase